jgi:two-component sensor histidine kinase/CheY-like chemotaxis protein
MSLNTKTPNILVVDDSDLNLDLLCKILFKANFETSTAIDGIDAIQKINSQPPELILLDVMMPKLDGFEVCRLLKKNPETQDIPIIFMTSLVDTEKKVEAFKLGASDYVTKPFQKAELLARVKLQLQILSLRQALKHQNHLLQHEIHQKYEVEISLLELNDFLSVTNQSLKDEIENRKIIEFKLQTEISDKRQAEQQLRQSLKEKDLLLKEIHHRVKNNLFIVSSLLESQADYTDDPQIIKILENSQNRVMSMALIHEQLHGNSSLFQIDFKQYLTVLTEHLIESYFTKEVNFQSNIQEAYLNIETAHPCGLIINELISNAVEHAFPNQKPGNIMLKFNQDEAGNCNLLLKDDGIGFPAHKDFYHSESLGLELVSTLVEQLEGEIEMKNNNGTEVKITFKELNYQLRV